eukprot:scaffold229938_cov18-Tisochrysis_lutea.AAC.1
MKLNIGGSGRGKPLIVRPAWGRCIPVRDGIMYPWSLGAVQLVALCKAYMSFGLEHDLFDCVAFRFISFDWEHALWMLSSAWYGFGVPGRNGHVLAHFRCWVWAPPQTRQEKE